MKSRNTYKNSWLSIVHWKKNALKEMKFFFATCKRRIFVFFFQHLFKLKQTKIMGGSRKLERRNLERPIFRNFKIANIKITKDELFDNFISEFNFSFFRNHLNTQNI